MLFTYPIAATNENWVNSILLDIIRNAVEALQREQEPAEFQNAVPVEYRPDFTRGTTFRKFYVAFIDQCRPLTSGQLSLVLDALAQQNNFPAVFAADTPCSSLAATLPAVHEATKNLFKYAFERLSAFKTPGLVSTIRSGYYHLVHPHLINGCCPFCGLEIVDAPDPDLVDPDLDHYLAVSKYPFAGVNLRNLTAMGTTCNRSYKGAKDILCDEHSQKVDCIDPYGNEQVTVSLEGTTLLTHEGQGPAWALSFNPDAKSQNWRRVFNLETRMKANVLDKQYQPWLLRFIKYAQKHEVDISNKNGTLEALRIYRDDCEDETLAAVSILKKKFFDLVEIKIADPLEGDRVHNFIRAIQEAYRLPQGPGAPP